ncbi:MAG: sigma-70 family RNA polymerase sigma factor [Marinifilaceae bacterium]|jgi:RNA polymerase sigma-70 factor (ECF subfamily)|nr:sigma-70 family RNA polymerase sigma factor [Marinifilaceae bacterium]
MQVSDYELVKSYQAGDNRSLENLISRHKNRVYTYIFLLVKNQSLAEDLFQETFIKIINSIRQGKYQDNGKFLAWVFRIAHNLVIDYFRKEKQKNLIYNEDYEMDIFNSKKLSESNYEDGLIDEQIRENVGSLISKLPEDQQEIVVMRHYKNLSFKEIADQTGISINTALGRMRYAIINLRKILDEKGVEFVVR